MVSPKERPEVLPGTTYKLKTGCGNIYVIINDHDGQPFEVFSVMGKSGGCAASYSEAIARLISLALRSGVEPKAIIKQLRGIACHQISWYEGEKIISCADAIGKALETNR
jgi:ribonucleoside-diphosphate reductase alpha chain